MTETEALKNSETQKPLYEFHYSSIVLDRWKSGDQDRIEIEDVTVYSDNLKNADEKCLDLVRYKLVNDCGYIFKTHISSVREVLK